MAYESSLVYGIVVLALAIGWAVFKGFQAMNKVPGIMWSLGYPYFAAALFMAFFAFFLMAKIP